MVKKFSRSKTPSAEDADGAAALPVTENGVPAAPASAEEGKTTQGSPLGKLKKRLSLGGGKNKAAAAAAAADHSKESSTGAAPVGEEQLDAGPAPAAHNDELSTVTEVTEPATVNGSKQASTLSAVSTTETNGDDTPKAIDTSDAAIAPAVADDAPAHDDSAVVEEQKDAKLGAMARLKKRISFSKSSTSAASPATPQDDNDKVAEAPAEDIKSVPEATESQLGTPTADDPVEIHDGVGDAAAPEDTIETKADPEPEPESEAPAVPAKEAKPSAMAKLKHKISFTKSSPAKKAEGGDEPAQATKDETKVDEPDLQPVTESGESRIVAAAEEQTTTELAVANTAPVEAAAVAIPVTVDEQESAVAPAPPAKDKESPMQKLKKKISFSKAKPEKVEEDKVADDQTKDDLHPLAESGESKIVAASSVETTKDTPEHPVEEPIESASAVAEEEESAPPVPAKDKETAMQKLRKKISFTKSSKAEEPKEDAKDAVELGPVGEAGESKFLSSQDTHAYEEVESKFVEVIPSSIISTKSKETEVTGADEGVPTGEGSTAVEEEATVDEAEKPADKVTDVDVVDATVPETTATEDEDKPGEVHATGGIEVTIPPPLPDSKLKTVGTADEIADQIKDAINAAPDLPGDGWDEDQTDPQPKDPSDLPHKHWKTNPKTGRPMPPDGCAPPNVDQKLLAVLQNEKMMREKGVFDALERMGGLKFLRDEKDDGGEGEEKGGEGDGEDGGEDDGEDGDEGDVYSRVDGLMLYAPLVPAEGDKVELADVLVVDPTAKEDKVRTIRAQDVNAKKKKGLAGLMGLWGLGWPFGGGADKKKHTEKDTSAPPNETPATDAPATDTPAEAPTNDKPADTPATPAPAPAPGKKGGKLKKKKPLSADAETKWVPSKDKLSFEATWWGYKLYLPPPVMDALSDDTMEAAKRAALITSALTWFFSHLPVDMMPLALQPALIILQKVVPYLSYIGTFITWSWSEVKSFDEGYGVILTATWLLPVALIPGTWKKEDFPTDPAPAPPSTTPADGTNPPTGTTPPASGTPPSGSAPPAETPPQPTTPPPASGDTSKTPGSTDSSTLPSTEAPIPSPAPADPATSEPAPTQPAPSDPATTEPSTPSTLPVNEVINVDGAPVNAEETVPTDKKKRTSWKLW